MLLTQCVKPAALGCFRPPTLSLNSDLQLGLVLYINFGNVSSVLSCRQLCVVSGLKDKVETYSSVGLDGAMVIWTFKVCHTVPFKNDLNTKLSD